MITGLEFSSEDKKAIEEGVESIENKITQKMSKIIDEELKDEDFTLQPAKVLGYMLKKGILEIKIIDVTGTGIGHPKIGVMIDDENNHISFSGSNNETGSGWLNNIEEFKVFKEYESVESDFYQIDETNFKNFWLGNTQRCTIYDLPGPIMNKFIEMAPEEIESLDRGYDDGITAPVEPLTYEDDLWPHQKIAIKAWSDPENWQESLDEELIEYLQSQSGEVPSTTNKAYQGILAMATGSGKTRTAVAASLFSESNVVTIIAMPLSIISQWENEIRDWQPENIKIIYAGGDKSNWRELLPLSLAAYRLGSPPSNLRRLYILGSYESISSEGFVNLFEGIPSKFVQLIGDEVHNFGKTIANAFKIKADRVLGLSATHTRWWDDEGTAKLESYFGEAVYEFDIQDGIDNNFLCHYDYFVNFVYMTETEQADYRELTNNIGFYSSKIQTTAGAEKAKFESLRSIALNERAKILRKADNKPLVVEEILNDNFTSQTEKAIVFCEDQEQVSKIEEILKKQNKIYNVFHSGLSPAQQNSALMEFKNTHSSRFLLGINMLDEGLDIPNSDKCVIVASTTNPRQFIQRRGRVLRKSTDFPDKHALIYDTIVVPDYSVPSGELSDAQETEAVQMGKILSKEISRVIQLNKSADHSDNVRQVIQQYVQNHNLEKYVTQVTNND